MGMWISFTKNPINPIMQNPTPTARAMAKNSLRSGFVHFFTRCILSFANCFSGSMSTSLNPSLSLILTGPLGEKEPRMSTCDQNFHGCMSNRTCIKSKHTRVATTVQLQPWWLPICNSLWPSRNSSISNVAFSFTIISLSPDQYTLYRCKISSQSFSNFLRLLLTTLSNYYLLRWFGCLTVGIMIDYIGLPIALPGYRGNKGSYFLPVHIYRCTWNQAATPHDP